MGKLENPPVDLAATLLEASLMLVAELIIANGAFVALPALFGLATARNWRRRLAKVGGRVGAWNTKVEAEIEAARKAIDASLKQRHEVLMRISDARHDGRACDLATEWRNLYTVDRGISSTQRWVDTVETPRSAVTPWRNG